MWGCERRERERVSRKREEEREGGAERGAVGLRGMVLVQIKRGVEGAMGWWGQCVELGGV